jgi:hypothetical protein
MRNTASGRRDPCPIRISSSEVVHTFEPSEGVIKQTQKAAGNGMSAEEENFRVGERVRLSDLGRQRMPRSKSTSAKVVGYGRGSAYPVSIHISYLERDE